MAQCFLLSMVHIANPSSSRAELKPPTLVVSGHLPGTLRASLNRWCQCWAPCAARATPARGVCTAQTHPSTAGTLPVPCRAQTLRQKWSRSFCIVWLRGDSVSPCPAPAAPIPARCRRDSHSLPVQDLFGLGLVQILAGC